MPRPNLGKVRVSLTVRRDVLEAAREYIPNLSQFLEDRLLEFLRWVNHPVAGSFEWARGGSNPGPLAYQAHQRASFPERRQENASFKVEPGLVEEYYRYRESRAKDRNWLNWVKRQIREFLEFSNYTINPRTLGEFQNWYKSNYGFEAQSKYHSNLRNFLDWLSRRTGNPQLKELKDVLEPPKRPSKKLNQIIIREEDVRNIIREIYDLQGSKFNPAYQISYFKIKYIAGVLFAAYTGQRPKATIGRLTFEDLENALSRSPPMLWIPEEKDKENFPHWIPLHPVVVEWLKAVVDFKDIAPSEKPFPYDPLRKLFDELNVKAIHTGRKITYSHLRKFFEQMCNNVLMVHPGLRDYIMAHNTGSLDVQSYDGKLPVEIYEQYMAAWKDVDLVPSGVKLEDLISQLGNSPAGE